MCSSTRVRVPGVVGKSVEPPLIGSRPSRPLSEWYLLQPLRQEFDRLFSFTKLRGNPPIVCSGNGSFPYKYNIFATAGSIPKGYLSNGSTFHRVRQPKSRNHHIQTQSNQQ